jgi:hypothetical protein
VNVTNIVNLTLNIHTLNHNNVLSVILQRIKEIV